MGSYFVRDVFTVSRDESLAVWIVSVHRQNPAIHSTSTVSFWCATAPKQQKKWNESEREKEHAKQNDIQQATKCITIHFYTTKYLTKR